MRKAIWAILLTAMVLFAGNALATITIESATVTCNPVNIVNNACYKYSNFTIKFVLTDSNAPNGIGDGNLQRWQPVLNVYSGTCSNHSLTNPHVSLTPTDTNLLSTKVCDTNGSDTNFIKARSCTLSVPYSSTLTNGTYCLDMNIQECSLATPGAACALAGGGIPSDKNTGISFTINNSTTTSATISVLGTLGLLLGAIAALIMLGLFAMGKVNMTETVIAIIVIGIAVLIFVLIFSPMVDVLSVG